MYEVEIDFDDDASRAPKHLENLTDLSLYLERVPSMAGFEANGVATVKIRTKWSRHPALPETERWK